MSQKPEAQLYHSNIFWQYCWYHRMHLHLLMISWKEDAFLIKDYFLPYHLYVLPSKSSQGYLYILTTERIKSQLRQWQTSLFQKNKLTLCNFNGFSKHFFAVGKNKVIVINTFLKFKCHYSLDININSIDKLCLALNGCGRPRISGKTKKIKCYNHFIFAHISTSVQNLYLQSNVTQFYPIISTFMQI